MVRPRILAAPRPSVATLDNERLVTIVLLGFGLFGGAIGLAGSRLLPVKYFYDAHFIQSIAQRTNLIVADSSYSSAATFYRLLDLQNSPSLVSILSLGIFFLAVSMALPNEIRHAVSPPTLVLVAISFVLAGIYLAPFSKDTIVLVAVVALIWFSRAPYAVAAMAAFVVGYATLFRTYWVLVAVSFLLLELICRRKTSPKLICAGVVIALATCAVIVEAKYGQTLSVFRRSVNASRDGSGDAVSIIRQYVPSGGIVSGWLNSLVTLLLLLIPIPLILLGGPIYLVSAGFLGWLTFRLRQLTSSGLLERSCDDDGGDGGRRQARHCVLMAVALVVVQSIYVPDYGSALKHLTPVLPLLIAAFARYDWFRAASRSNREVTVGSTRSCSAVPCEQVLPTHDAPRLAVDDRVATEESLLAFERALGMPGTQ